MDNTPGIGLSLGAVAIGAVLAFAVSASTPGVSLPAVGAILMVIGMVGFATCLWLDWSRRRAYAPPQPPPAPHYRDDYDQTQQYYR